MPGLFKTTSHPTKCVEAAVALTRARPSPMPGASSTNTKDWATSANRRRSRDLRRRSRRCLRACRRGQRSQWAGTRLVPCGSSRSESLARCVTTCASTTRAVTSRHSSWWLQLRSAPRHSRRGRRRTRMVCVRRPVPRACAVVRRAPDRQWLAREDRAQGRARQKWGKHQIDEQALVAFAAPLRRAILRRWAKARLQLRKTWWYCLSSLNSWATHSSLRSRR